MAYKRRTSDLLADIADHWPQVSSPESDIVLALIRLNRIVRSGLEKLLRAEEITPAAFDVLVTLRSLPTLRRLTPTDLHRATLLSSGGLTKILATLAERGFIQLATNEADARSKTVGLTPEGGRFVEDIAQRVAVLDKALFAERLTAQQIAKLRASLLESLAALEA